MIVYVKWSVRFSDNQSWNVTATDFYLEDTYQVAAQKALRFVPDL
jgi:hypothetical protein